MLLKLFHTFGNEACRHGKNIKMVLKREKNYKDKIWI
jgi:hypothetical protein